MAQKLEASVAFNLADLKSGLASMIASSKKAAEDVTNIFKTAKTSVDTTGAVSSVHKLGDAARQAAERFVGMEKQANQTSGGIASSFKNATASIGSMGASVLGVFGGGALLAGLGGIHEAFSQMVEGAKEADDAADGLSIALAKAGLEGDDLTKEQKRLGAAARKTAEDFAIPATEVAKLQAKITGFSGATGQQLDELVDFSLGASNALQLPAEAVAKMLGKAADPEAQAKLKSLGIVFDKDATAAEKMQIIQAKLGATIQATKDSTQDAVGAFDRIGQSVHEFTIGLASGLFDAFGEVLHALSPFVDAFKTAFDGMGGGMGDFFGSLKETLHNAVEFMRPVIEFLADKVAGAVLLAFTIIKTQVTLAFSIVKSVFAALYDAVRPLIDQFTGLGAGTFSLTAVIKQIVPIIEDWGGVLAQLGKILVNVVLVPMKVLWQLYATGVGLIKGLFTGTKELAGATKESGEAAGQSSSFFEKVHNVMVALQGVLGGTASAFRFLTAQVGVLFDALVHLNFEKMKDVMVNVLAGTKQAFTEGQAAAIQANSKILEEAKKLDDAVDELSLERDKKKHDATQRDLQNTQANLQAKLNMERAANQISAEDADAAQKILDNLWKVARSKNLNDTKEENDKLESLEKEIIDTRTKLAEKTRAEERAALRNDLALKLATINDNAKKEIDDVNKANELLAKEIAKGDKKFDPRELAQLHQLRADLIRTIQATSYAEQLKAQAEFNDKETAAELKVNADFAKFKADQIQASSEADARTKHQYLLDSLLDSKALELFAVKDTTEAANLERAKINEKYNALIRQNERELQIALDDVRIAAITDTAEREYAIKKATAEQTLAKELDDAKGNALKAAEARQKAEIAVDEALSELRQRRASSESEAELIRSVAAAEKRYKEDAELFANNEDRKSDAFDNYLDARKAAESKYLDDTNAAYSFSLSLRASLLDSFFKKEDSQKNDQLAKAREDAVKDQTDALRDLQDKAIGFEDYQKKNVEAARKAADAQKQIEEDKVGFIARLNEGLVNTLKKLAERQIINAQQTGDRYIQSQQELSDAQRAIDKADADEYNAKLDNDNERVDAAIASRAAAKKKMSDAEAAGNKAITDTYKTLAVNVGASLASMVLDGQAAGRSLVIALIEATKAMVPALVVQILGKEFAEKGILGIATSGLLTGLLYGALSIAENEAGKMKFAQGVVGFRGKGSATSDSNPVFISNGESVITTDGTNRNRALLEFINKGGSSQDYFWSNYMPQINKIMSASLTAMIQEKSASFISAQGKLFVAPNQNIQIDGRDIIGAELARQRSETNSLLSSKFDLLNKSVQRVEAAVQQRIEFQQALDLNIKFNNAAFAAEQATNARIEALRS